MATLSHEAHRRLIEKFGGCDEYFTEMINAGSLLTNGPFEKFYLMNETVPEKMVWQLTGGKTALIERAVPVVAELGGVGIDLNMGCCAPEIVASGAGIAWMLKPVEETWAMVHAVRRAMESCSEHGQLKLRLSVKLRLGDENFTDEGFFSFCKMLMDEGVQQLTLHPRTKKQKYTRPARWEYVEKLAGFAKPYGVCIILNGDVKDVESAKSAMKASPSADGLMIGRMAAQKPWIFAQIARSFACEDSDRDVLRTKIDLQQLIFEYLDDLQIYQPKEFWKTRCQRFFTYFCSNFSFAHYARTQLVNATCISQAKERLVQYFEKVPEDRFISAV
ncbi:MAG: tRNA-dihydrouridine synthase family protein [Treponema sp.]|nr:tRNA-dihydrouridine synthase family protein [Spirochaetia bacterium]MDY5683838.1 tRNA-dihydrouridine synthase family protein [Treponema sp.]